jgi:LysW-gamma-L-lysine carboxypeptidase
MVAIWSLSGEEKAVAEFLVAQMQAWGMAAEVDAVGNAVGFRECPDANGETPCEIVLLGHMDTVPGDIPVRIEEGVLYGRGAVDAKGPLAAFTIAAAQAELPPGTRLVVVGAVEEEAATSKGARYAAERFRPSACIIGEPSGWDGVTLGYKGRLLLDYILWQPMGHTAGPDVGVGETAVAFWNAINHYAQQFNRDRPRLFDQLMPSLRHIQTSSDGLTNRAEAKVGLRLPPGFDVAAFETAVREWAGTADIQIYGYEPAFHGLRSSPLARTFNIALRQAGVRPRFKLKTGTSDMNVVGPVWNCPIVAYGPGDSLLDHTPNEHIVLEEYCQAVEILQSVLAALPESISHGRLVHT